VDYRIVLGDQARHQLSHLTGATLDTILDCLLEMQEDPYRDLHLRVTVVIPLYRTYPDSYLCGSWAIAYQVRPNREIFVEGISQYFYRP
jgi:myosin-crossreactive antigen